MKEKVREILEEIEPMEDFEDETELIASGLLDSLSIVYLVTRLEEDLKIFIDEKYVMPENFENINAIVRLLEKIQSN